MKKLFIILLTQLALINIAGAQTAKFASVAGQEAAFNAKYKLTASIDEKTMTLKWSTDAAIIKAVLSVYTKEQLAVRKGTDHTYPFNTPVKTYQFDLNAPAYKGFYAYWLKVYTRDGLWQEYFFRQTEKVDEAPTSEGEYTTIKTNIKCETGKKKVTDALKEMDGVFDVKIDIATGKLLLKYSSDGTPYTGILTAINANGFDADDQKTNNASANPCKTVATQNNNEEKKDATGATIINTNIKCAAGKTKVIAALKAMDGVFDVKIDTKTGKLTIKYSSDGTPYTTILSTINENGFIANRQKPSKGILNPCSTRID